MDIDITVRQTPGKAALHGQYSKLLPVVWKDHYSDFYKTLLGPQNAHLWEYMSIGPFEDAESCARQFRAAAQDGGWGVMMIYAEGGTDVVGTASFMRRRETHGSAEIGFILFSPQLQKTRAATDAIYQMLKHLFDDLNYRRVEWKCDNKNDGSKRAAHRFGFTFEGIFRQDLIVKGKNRDTAWFSIIDSEWPEIRSKFENWMSVENFDRNGQQLSRLKAT